MRFTLLLLGLLLCLAVPALPATPDDVANSPRCAECGMSRKAFSHSRMVVEYADGTTIATCSLHCATTALAKGAGKGKATLKVADYNSKKLIPAESAVWVIGGSKRGVMTGTAKWAFAEKAEAERFVKENGGTVTDFAAASRAARTEIDDDSSTMKEFEHMKGHHHAPQGD
ncbi:NosL family protein [Geomonas sp. Red276]